MCEGEGDLGARGVICEGGGEVLYTGSAEGFRVLGDAQGCCPLLSEVSNPHGVILLTYLLTVLTYRLATD